MNLLLIGLRGSGKTTLGRALAQRLRAPFIDLDDRTRDLLAAPTVAAAWKTVGESAFRAAEVEALREALLGEGKVVALGGGTPTAPGAEAALAEASEAGRAYIIYLRCDAATLRRRLAETIHGDADRPSLTGADPLDEVEAVYAKRDPVYVAIADAVVEGVESAAGGLAALERVALDAGFRGGQAASE